MSEISFWGGHLRKPWRRIRRKHILQNMIKISHSWLSALFKGGEPSLKIVKWFPHQVQISVETNNLLTLSSSWSPPTYSWPCKIQHKFWDLCVWAFFATLLSRDRWEKGSWWDDWSIWSESKRLPSPIICLINPCYKRQEWKMER